METSKAKLIIYDLFKIRQTFLLTLSGVLAYLIASGRNVNPTTLALLILSLYLSVSGTTGLNMFLDRDIDAVMFRTMGRALPSKRLSEKEALAASLPVLAAGLIVASLIDPWVLIADVIGVVVDIILYTYLLKRRTVFNIVLGSIAGGMPAFGGWCAYTGSPGLPAILITLIVALWAMLHIWYISSYFDEDYRRAGVPMLPVVYGFKFTGRVSVVITLLIFLSVLGLYHMGVAGPTSLGITALLTGFLLYMEIMFIDRTEKALARRIYKYLNMYLGIILVFMTIENLV